MLLINQKNNIKIFAVTCLKQIVLDDWNRLNLDKNPFLLYEFLLHLNKVIQLKEIVVGKHSL